MLAFIPLHRIFCGFVFLLLICLTVRKLLLFLYDRHKGNDTKNQRYSLAAHFFILLFAYYASGHYHMDTRYENDYYSGQCKSPDKYVLQIIESLNGSELIQNHKYMTKYHERSMKEKSKSDCQDFRRKGFLNLASTQEDSILLKEVIKYGAFTAMRICSDSSLTLFFRERKSPKNLVLAEDHYFTRNQVFYKANQKRYDQAKRGFGDYRKIFVDLTIDSDWRYIKRGGNRYNR